MSVEFIKYDFPLFSFRKLSYVDVGPFSLSCVPLDKNILITNGCDTALGWYPNYEYCVLEYFILC